MEPEPQGKPGQDHRPEWERRAAEREMDDPRRRAELQERLDRVLAEQLPFLLGAASGIYLGLMGWRFWWMADDPYHLWLTASAATLTILFGAVALLLGHRPIDGAEAHPMALATILPAVGDGMLQVGLTGDPMHSTGFMLLLVACGAFLTDLRWLRGALAVVLLGWAIAMAAAALGTPQWPHFGIGILFSAALALVIGTLRIRTIRRVESMNLELRGLIGFDSLTGIGNRRAFQERLQDLWRRLREERAPLSLLLCDLDYFKNLNDTRGHGEGDAALRQVGGILRFAVRSTDDLPARLGGEEFGVLLPRTTKDQALLVAERIRQATALARIPNPGAPTGDTLTMSIGLAVSWPSRNATGDSLVDRADQALYSAKETGRNKVVVEEGRPGAIPDQGTIPLTPRPPASPHRDSASEEGSGLPSYGERELEEFGRPPPEEELPPPTDDPFWTPSRGDQKN